MFRIVAQTRSIAKLRGTKVYQPPLCFNQLATLLQPKITNRKQYIMETQKASNFPFLHAQKLKKNVYIALRMIQSGLFTGLDKS